MPTHPSPAKETSSWPEEKAPIISTWRNISLTMAASGTFKSIADAIGGIGPAKRVADYAASKSVTFVNHTFTSHLALSASLQPYAGMRTDEICEYPFAPKSLARELTSNHLERDSQGYVAVPESPGLGIDINTEAARRYLVDVEIKVKGNLLFASSDQL